MAIPDDDAMALVEQAIDILRRAHAAAPPGKELGAPLVPAGVAISMWQILDELGDNAPVTVVGVLDLINGLIADPRIDLVTDCGEIEFAWWVGDRP